MSTYLGFPPTQRPSYFFVSYNSDDSVLVASFVKSLYHNNVPLWYDYGIEYGEKWEEQITLKIKDCQAILLFFTKGIFLKEQSYVKREYDIAKFLNKKIYVVIVDKIEKEDIPINKLSWWIDIQENQCIDLKDRSLDDEPARIIMEGIGYTNHNLIMNSLIQQYRELYDRGEAEKAETFLNEYLHSRTIQDQIDIIAHIVLSNNYLFASNNQSNFKGEFKRPLFKRRSLDEKPKVYQKGSDYSYGCLRYKDFIIGIELVCHRGTHGDATIVDVWRKNELIYTFGGLIEASDVGAYYDSLSDILFVYVFSSTDDDKTVFSIIAIEKPDKEALCTKAVWVDNVKK